ncbi:plasmid pRiA4b ORF-3 family protein [Nostoc sp. UHCC 0870]|uniref:plasmid pRiA4b ORF-3 family protein n=1 Tax=Nostoc sp. UHCC 0870 TaxID=2914041 RepID=UPI001EDF023A|nr:plasmid pRiA4b ORF-3 family protein [Nostoc sp. UHCC 0870]UKP01023.1 plasmid pRiA4b ORF-3 family protein [Nostoc sp. UHCC 0870]
MFYPNNSEANTINPDELQLLYKQQISESSPGSILKDFQMLLDFIGTKGIEVSKTQNFLPMSCLAELNSRLTHPIQVELNRPQQKAYPHIHGLYLLLRASTISYVEPQGKKFFLYLEPNVLESWNDLNPTERYFNLLETWWIWGNEEILGEKGWRNGLDKCLMFWCEFGSSNSLILKAEQQKWYSYSPGLYQIALFSMFGLLEVETTKPKKGQGWQFKKLNKTPWGNALVKLIKKIIVEESHSDINQKDLEEEEYPFGIWQPQLQIFFPEWQNNLAITAQYPQQGIYIFKVNLGKIWRRIAIPHDYSLYDLSSTILESVNFDDDHLHEFSYKSRFGWTGRVSHPSGCEPPFSNEYLIEDLSLYLKVGQTINYLFDYGDSWQFKLHLESIEPDNVEIKEPTILNSYGTAPEQYPSWDEDEEWDDEDGE